MSLCPPDDFPVEDGDEILLLRRSGSMQWDALPKPLALEKPDNWVPKMTAKEFIHVRFPRNPSCLFLGPWPLGLPCMPFRSGSFIKRLVVWLREQTMERHVCGADSNACEVCNDLLMRCGRGKSHCWRLPKWIIRGGRCVHACVCGAVQSVLGSCEATAVLHATRWGRLLLCKCLCDSRAHSMVFSSPQRLRVCRRVCDASIDGGGRGKVRGRGTHVRVDSRLENAAVHGCIVARAGPRAIAAPVRKPHYLF